MARGCCSCRGSRSRCRNWAGSCWAVPRAGPGGGCWDGWDAALTPCAKQRGQILPGSSPVPPGGGLGAHPTAPQPCGGAPRTDGNGVDQRAGDRRAAGTSPPVPACSGGLAHVPGCAPAAAPERLRDSALPQPPPENSSSLRQETRWGEGLGPAGNRRPRGPGCSSCGLTHRPRHGDARGRTGTWGRAPAPPQPQPARPGPLCCSASSCTSGHAHPVHALAPGTCPPHTPACPRCSPCPPPGSRC